MLEAVVFQAPYPPYNQGETAGVPPEVAERLVASGRAVRPGSPLSVPLSPVLQGNAPQPVTCGACGAVFMPRAGDPVHRCAPGPMAGAAIFEAGFNHGPPRRRGRRGR